MAGEDIGKEKQVEESFQTLAAQGRVPEPPAQGQRLLVSIVHENGCCKVEPAVLHARPMDTIHWKVDGAAGGGHLFFPNGKLFGTPDHDIPFSPDVSKGLQMQPVSMGRYPYAVYCGAHNCFAVGNSDPRIDYP